MGIERFFSSLNRNFDVISDIKKPYSKISCSHFFIDFNSIIHNISSEMITKINLYKQKKIETIEYKFESIKSFEDELINQVIKYIKNLLGDNLISDRLEYLMLAIDGVPTFAKIVEQKKRRYIGDLLLQLMKKFNLPFEWSKNNISPGTEFMNKISLKLKEKLFLDECKSICKNLKQILISDVYNPGEGEMKIMECLRTIKYIDSYDICVYSPDSDMILLLMILDIPVNIFRFDQQKSQKENESIFNLIDVIKFKSELVKYCKERIDIEINSKLLIDEIVYIFTLFGDDFLPKTESVNVSEDINLIIDNYLLTKLDKGNILLQKNNLYEINYDNLFHFFNLVSQNQIEDLNRYFYESKFKNYRWAQDNNFNYYLSKFSEEIKNIFENSENSDEDIQALKDKILNGKHTNQPYFNFIYNISKKLDGKLLYDNFYSKKNYKNVKKYKSLFFLKRTKKEILEDLINYSIENDFELPFQNYIRFIKSNKAIKVEEFINRSFEKKFHINKMKKLNLFNPGKEREQLEYLIQNKLDKFYHLFNPVNFFYKTKVTSVEKYYQIMFPKQEQDLIIEKYIEGFEWILNYYFNNKIDYLWFYPFSRSPLLSDVVNSNKKYTNLNFTFNQNEIFTPLELITYITPIDSYSKLDFLPNFITSETKGKIYTFIEKNLFMFINLKEIYFLLNTNPESLSDLFDCSVSVFLNKCHYKLLEKDIKPKLYLEKFRLIIPLKDQVMRNLYNLECKRI